MSDESYQWKIKAGNLGERCKLKIVAKLSRNMKKLGFPLEMSASEGLEELERYMVEELSYGKIQERESYQHFSKRILDKEEVGSVYKDKSVSEVNNGLVICGSDESHLQVRFKCSIHQFASKMSKYQALLVSLERNFCEFYRE